MATRPAFGSRMKISNIQKLLLTLWFAIAAASVWITAFHLKEGHSFETNVLKLLPAGQSNLTTQAVESKLNETLSQRAALILPDSKNPAKTLASRDLIKQQLLESSLFLSVLDGTDIGILQNRTAFYKPYRYQLLSRDDEQAIKTDSDAFLDRSIIQRSGLFGLPQSTNILEDPALTFQNWLSLLQISTKLKIDKHGFVASDEHNTYRVVLLQLQHSPFKQEYQAELMLALQNAEQLALTHNPELTIIHSGLVFHAFHASQQAKKEISTIGLGSMLGAITLLLLAFRTGTPIFMSLGAMAFGFLGALATCLLIFEEIHLITLAFGASLIGVSIDYSFHYFSSQQSSPHKLLSRISPALLLALSSSVLAYLALALTPFPGLRQMGVFSAAGLSISCLTVFAVYPLFSSVPTRPPLEAFRNLKRSTRPNAAITLTATSLALVLGIAMAPWKFEDDVRLLNSSPKQLLNNEKLTQKLISGFDSSRYLLFTGNDWQSILQAQEATQALTATWINKNQLGGIQLLSEQIPSIARQKENRKILEEYIFNEATLKTHYEKFGVPSEAATQSMALFQEFESTILDWDVWSRSIAAKPLAHLWVESQNFEKAAIAPLVQPINAEAFQSLDSTSIRYIDKVRDISNLMKSYRQEISLLLAISYGLVFLILYFRFKQQAFFIILVPFLSTLCAFGLVSSLGISLNIFNILASLLVLGIGLDMGIVLRESSYSENAWQTVSLSACTTILAFGLLSLSETPVLYHFGLTILFGITFNWFFSWLLTSRQHHRESST